MPMTMDDHAWIGESVRRHLQRFLIHEGAISGTFPGFYESNIVGMLSRSAIGLGYDVYLERKCYADGTSRADLALREPDGGFRFIIEVKVIYDGDDNTLLRNKLTGGAIYKDLELLSRHTAGNAHRLAFWVVFSPDLDDQVASPASSQIRLGDLLLETVVRFPSVRLTQRLTIDCAGLIGAAACEKSCKYAHLLTWSFL